jgi:CubicO group peptidase (beta-lactamase class C family)
MSTTRFGWLMHLQKALPRLRVGLACVLAVAAAHSPAWADGPVKKKVGKKTAPQTAVIVGQAIGGQAVGPAAVDELASGPTVPCDLERFADNLKTAFDGKSTGYQIAIFHDAKLFKEIHGGMARTSSDAPARSMSASDRLEIGSISKPLNAMCTIKVLASKGKTVDEKIGKYVPSTWQKHASIDNITFKQLLSHAAGLEEFSKIDPQDYTPGKINDGIRAALKKGVCRPQTPAYDNMNYEPLRVLLPYLVDPAGMKAAEGDEEAHEKALADCFAGLVRQHVFQPAGIGTKVYLKDWHPSGADYAYARYYDFAAGGAGLAGQDRSLRPGRGGWKLTAKDLCQVFSAYEAGYVLTPAQETQMKDQKLGIFSRDSEFGKIYGHNGKSHNGNQTGVSQCYLYPGNTQVVLLVNSGNNTHGNRGDAMVNAWLDACKQPDLVVTSFAATGAAKYEDGKLKVPFSMTVKNQGKASTRLDFFNGVKYGDDIRWSGQMAELAAGSQKNTTGTISIPDPQKKLAGKKVKLVAWADAWITAADTSLPAYARVKESNEPNNLTKAFEVQAPAVIGSVVAVPVDPKPAVVALPGADDASPVKPGRKPAKPTVKPMADDDDSPVKPIKPVRPKRTKVPQ